MTLLRLSEQRMCLCAYVCFLVCTDCMSVRRYKNYIPGFHIHDWCITVNLQLLCQTNQCKKKKNPNKQMSWLFRFCVCLVTVHGLISFPPLDILCYLDPKLYRFNIHSCVSLDIIIYMEDITLWCEDMFIFECWVYITSERRKRVISFSTRR